MKKISIILLFLVFLQLGCKKETLTKTGDVEVTISYFYNDYQGYKPDVDATIYLFKQTGKTYERKYLNFRIGALKVVGTDETVYSDYKATANVNGIATVSDVPFGDYLLVVASKGRFSYSVKSISLTSPKHKEVKNFGYRSEFDDKGESW